MNKFLAIGLLASIFTLSAQAITCPSQVICTNSGTDGTQTKCTSNDNSIWVQSPYNAIDLPSPNTPYTFTFLRAGSSIDVMTHARWGTSCYYTNPQVVNLAIFYATPSLSPDLTTSNSWTYNGLGTYDCNSNSVSQCPLTSSPPTKK